MATVAFTANNRDHSNDTGYQWEFLCDKCGNGVMTSFQASKMGMATGFLKAAGGLLGGRLSSLGHAGDQIKDTLRGKARDEAFARAVEEGKKVVQAVLPLRPLGLPGALLESQGRAPRELRAGPGGRGGRGPGHGGQGAGLGEGPQHEHGGGC